jgi:hypothetical protein
MGIKFCFYGTSCYDLILYAARVLKHCKMSVLLLDSSKEQSLTCAIPDVKGLEQGIRDYRGIAFSKDRVPIDIQRGDYDATFQYFGEYPDRIEAGDYNFIVSDCELHTVNRLSELKSKLDTTEHFKLISVSENDEQYEGMEDDTFPKGCLNLIILGSEASSRKNYVASQFHVSPKECFFVDMDESNMECRIRCQYDTVFRFQRISEEYQDLVNRICFSVLGNSISEKAYRKAYQKAERGK